jgi:hypothetical protein
MLEFPAAAECVRMCTPRAPLVTNVLPQPSYVHAYGRSPVMCVYGEGGRGDGVCYEKSPNVLQAPGRPQQLCCVKGGSPLLSPVCRRRWAERELRSEKALPQPSQLHTCRLSPRCIRLWVARLLLWVNVFPQPSKSQAYGRSPVWVRMWITRPL